MDGQKTSQRKTHSKKGISMIQANQKHCRSPWLGFNLLWDGRLDFEEFLNKSDFGADEGLGVRLRRPLCQSTRDSGQKCPQINQTKMQSSCRCFSIRPDVIGRYWSESQILKTRFYTLRFYCLVWSLIISTEQKALIVGKELFNALINTSIYWMVDIDSMEKYS